MRALPCLLLPLLLLACHGPEAAPGRQASPVRAQDAGSAATVEIVPDTDVEIPDALRAEFQAAWEAELQGPGAARLRGARLQLFVKRYHATPAHNRFLTLGLPGIGSGAAGAVILASRSGSGLADFVPTVVGSGLVATGLVFLVLGIVIGGHQAHLDRTRGYALQQFKVRASVELVVDGKRERWNERYKSSDLSDAAPLPPEAAHDPAQVRREMMRALARKIRQDLDGKFR